MWQSRLLSHQHNCCCSLTWRHCQLKVMQLVLIWETGFACTWPGTHRGGGLLSIMTVWWSVWRNEKLAWSVFFSLYNLVIYFFNNCKPHQKMPLCPCGTTVPPAGTWRVLHGEEFSESHTVQEALNWMFFFLFCWIIGRWCTRLHKQHILHVLKYWNHPPLTPL